MIESRPTGDVIMKELITVKANLEDYNISMDMEELDGLPIHECDFVLTRLQRNIKAYQDLRHARVKVESYE